MYTDPKILESIKRVEAHREENAKLDPRRMTAEEKEVLLRTFHPDYREILHSRTIDKVLRTRQHRQYYDQLHLQ